MVYVSFMKIKKKLIKFDEIKKRKESGTLVININAARSSNLVQFPLAASGTLPKNYICIAHTCLDFQSHFNSSSTQTCNINPDITYIFMLLVIHRFLDFSPESNCNIFIFYLSKYKMKYWE